jgi:hypothetical protein
MADISPPMTYVHVPKAGHLIHDDASEAYRRAVEIFLAGLDGPDLGA